MDGGGGRGTPKIKGDGTDLKNNFFGNFSENFLENMDQREGGIARSLLPPSAPYIRYGSDTFQIYSNMIVVTVFLLIVNQTEFRSVHNKRKTVTTILLLKGIGNRLTKSTLTKNSTRLN